MFSIMYIFFLLVFVVLVYVTYVYVALFKARKRFQWMPQAPRWPLLGSIFEFGDHTETLNDCTRLLNNSSKLCYIEIAYYWHVGVTDHDFAQFVLSSNTILDKAIEYKFFSSWLGTGLLTAPGPKWRRRRKVITPAFHFSILEQFVEVFDVNSNTLINKLKLEAVNKDSVDIYDYVTACALDTICESAMGVNIDTQNNKHQDYVFAVKDICRIILTRTFSSWRRFDLLFRFTEDYKKEKQNLKILHGFTTSVIQKRIRELDGIQGSMNLEKDNLGRTRKLAFLDLLLNSKLDGKPLGLEDIREEVDTFMFEGHDTTSSAIASALFLLANHPEIQAKAREEQKQIYGEHRDRATTYHDLQEMKYLDLVIKETLRLYPSVPIVSRCVSEDTNYKGHVIPKGTSITIFIYGINRDPDYYEEPEEFRPERFLDEEGKQPYSYIPFSAGPRNCIGQKFAVLEMKTMISKIIRTFELMPTNPPHKMLLSSEAILKSLNGVKIRLKRHNW